MHFLGKVNGYQLVLEKPRAAVTVRVNGKKVLTVIAGINVAKVDTRWVELPSDIIVMGLEAQRIKPSVGKKFYVSTETLDPFHTVMEHE